jgi:hypothetical protein
LPRTDQQGFAVRRFLRLTEHVDEAALVMAFSGVGFSTFMPMVLAGLAYAWR